VRRLALRVLGLEVLAVEVGHGDDDQDNRTDPGDAVTTGYPIGFGGVWQRPDLPALEVD